MKLVCYKKIIIILLIAGKLIHVNAQDCFDIFPKSQYYEAKGFKVVLDNQWKIVVDTSSEEYMFSADWFKEKIEKANSLNLNIVDFNEMPHTKRIILGNINNDSIANLFQQRNMLYPDTLGMESYSLEVFNDQGEEIIIVSNAPNGSFYGIQSLLQLIHSDNTVDGLSIIDYPQHKTRGIYVSSDTPLNFEGYPPVFTEKQKDYIDKVAGWKINTLVYSGNFFQDDQNFMQTYIDIADYCRKRFIEFIPEIPGIRNNFFFPFDLHEGWWMRNEKFSFGPDGKAIAKKPMVNILSNGNFETDADWNGIPDEWRFTGSVSMNSEQKYEGRYSLKLESGYAYIDFPVEANKHYYVTGWGKGNATVCLNAKEKGGNYWYIWQCDDISGSDWSKFGITMRSNPDVENISIRIWKGSGDVYLDDFRLFRVDGGLRNVIRSESTDIVITNLDQSLTYLEGSDYRIINGEVSNPFHPDLKPFEIERIDEGNIGAEQEVLVSYDAHMYYDLTHSYNQPSCVSDEKMYLEYYYPAIDRVIQYLKPKTIFLGSDEIRGFHRDSRCKKRGLTNAELLSEYINKLNDYVKSKDPDCETMIWDDMVSPYHNGGDVFYQVDFGGSPGRMDEATRYNLLDSTVSLLVWWYSDKMLPQMNAATSYYASKGYNYLGAPSGVHENIVSWSQLLADESHARGAIDTYWGGGSYDRQYPFFADQMWNSRGKKILELESFEKDVDNNGIPDGWNYTGFDPARAYSCDGDNNQGKTKFDYSKCAISVKGDDKIWYSDYMTVKSGSNYRLSAYIKRHSENGVEKPGMKMVWYNAEKQKISEAAKRFFDVVDNYGRYELMGFSPEGAKYVVIQLEGEENGMENFWFDTVQFKMEEFFNK